MWISKPTVKIIADSITEEGKRLTTFECTYWRPILPEFNTHRCLIGSTKLVFDMPSGINSDKPKALNMTLEEFWDKWENGATEGKVPAFIDLDPSLIDVNKIYTSKEINKLFNVRISSNINLACRFNKLVAKKGADNRTWEFTGQAFLDYRNAMGKRRFNLKSRLQNMYLRSYNTATNSLDHTLVTDCWKVGEEEVYTVKTANYEITGTADHPLLTNKGWKEIKDLIVGEDSLKVLGMGTGLKIDPHKKINGNWVSRWNKQVLPEVLERQGNVCADCGQETGIYDVHHIEPRHSRPDLAFDINNVVAICPTCHRKRHKNQGWQIGCPHTIKEEVIESITSQGVQTVYDIAVASPEHNFIANGVVAHNCFSRNTASSRAKPFYKRVEEATKNTFVPDHWNAEKPGMVGGEEFDPSVKEAINLAINSLANITAEYINGIDELVYNNTGKHIHKQYLNRYLEPFIGCTQLITSTDWDNWFRLRMASDAQPEIKDVATEMFYALQSSEPKLLKKGEWHLPYTDDLNHEKYDMNTLQRISVARCARISYKTYEAGGVVAKDLELFDQLYKDGHLSPFEHVATPQKGHHFNLNGWKSLRYDLESDSRSEAS